MLGGVIFIAALAVAPLARRLRESEALVRQRDLDLANLAELSQYIVERLRESLVVVDEQDRIRLINESGAPDPRQRRQAGCAARRSVASTALPARDVAPERPGTGYGRRQPAGRRRPAGSAPAFRAARRGAAAAGAGVPRGPDRPRRPHPADAARRARPAVRLDRPRDQESGRRDQPRGAAAARGREALRCEPAHERDHPGQRRARQHDHRQRAAARPAREHPTGTHAARRNGSPTSCRNSSTPAATSTGSSPPRCPTRTSRCASIRRTCTRSCGTSARTPSATRCRCPKTRSNCASAGWPAAIAPSSRCSTAAPASTRRISDRIFEPFFTSRTSGTGLGLFIARELAQCNRALLVFEPRTGGGSIFRIVFADPQRWEQT